MTQPIDERALGFATQQLHAGARPDDANDARATPIYLTAGFAFDDFAEARDRFAGAAPGYTYSRNANPTVAAVESRLAVLEGGTDALLVASGQAAVSIALLGLLRAGDHVVASERLYEGSRGLLLENLGRLGVTTSFVADAGDAAAWHAAIRPETRAVFVESIPNPTNDVTDIALVADVAHGHGIPLVVDNTLATPYLLRPLEHGADIVVHSASKFLSGHGTVIAGAVVTGNGFDWGARPGLFPELSAPSAWLGGRSHVEAFGPAAYIAYTRSVVASRLGPTLSPLNAFLLEQGIETLSLRVERQSANALAIAEWLAARPEVASVDYAGLPGSPHHAVARRYLERGYGSVFSFTLAGGAEAAERVVDAVSIFTRMTHLGDVRSLILHPRSTTHTLRTDEQLRRTGIGEGLLRLSVGTEDVADLIADLERAFAAIEPAHARRELAGAGA